MKEKRKVKAHQKSGGGRIGELWRMMEMWLSMPKIEAAGRTQQHARIVGYRLWQRQRA